jgi:hypothetical protein
VPKKASPRSVRKVPGVAHSPAGPLPPLDDAVRINIPGESLLTLSHPERNLQHEALRWSYALRNRERWNTQKDALQTQQTEIRKLAAELGLRPHHLDRISKAGIVEVDIPWFSDSVGWDLRIFPWEFMLATATLEGRWRSDQSLTVVRHLRVGRGNHLLAPQSWLQVISAPGKLAIEYDFESERRLLETCMPIKERKVLSDPDEMELRQTIASHHPDIIHLSGFDSHQGMAILAPDRTENLLDGYLVRSASEPTATVVVNAERLAQILTSAPVRPPLLVACNFYNSGARIAPMCVAHGAAAGIGFQDSFDDELAELFYTTFYQAWNLTGDWNLTSAFQYAWQSVRGQGRPLQGSGVVLWSDRSILGEVPEEAAEPEQKRTQQIRKAWSNRSTEKPTADTIRTCVDVDVVPIPRINYSILHNNGPIFERFRLRKLRPEVGRIDGILVNVELYVGTDSYPFRLQVSIDDTASHLDLPDQIRVSLASNLSRGIRESIHTNLFVEVIWGNIMLYRRTHRVTLLPVDEWRFDTNNYRWLPSFVLPRDSAVLRVVDSAQRYLMALRDDATAGFDGYQCVDQQEGAKLRMEQCEMVDMQVRAIWSALLYETPLSYINPPPSFTESSQRLRTPSDCVDGKRGTCIDLALLLASCLEYVDIYPAVFLLRTHAFPAYWRHSSFHDDFRVARSAALQTEPERVGGRESSAPGQSFAWDFQAAQYREILGEVQAGRLVPLETTLVTGRGSFADAIAIGVQNLANRREFESMQDILLARLDKSSVTPLPVRRSEI